MQVLLFAFGSTGDVLPAVGLGSVLRGRGHEVTIISSGHFRPLVERAGLALLELYSAAEYAAQMADNGRWTPARFLQRGARRLLDKMETAYHLIAEHHVPGETLVVAQPWVFGARIAEEKLGVPLATLHLQPVGLSGPEDEPGWPHGVPHWLARRLHGLAHGLIDRFLGPPTNAFRSRLALPPVAGLLRTWWHSPQLVLGFFPEWFAAPGAGWPSQTRLVGFPLYDGPAQADPHAEALEAFLDEGEPPVVFSHSSLMKHAGDYFKASARAAALLGRRAILVTPHAEQVPAMLPAGVRHFSYVPFGRLLRRAAAHVHPGGIGTIAQTLAAGIPQLTMPLVNDQPDNCRRLVRLGVAARIRPRDYRPRVVARRLRELLETPAVAERCRYFAERCGENDALPAAAVALEQLFFRATLPVSSSHFVQVSRC
jgi:rhamnosyltransferase subunit B